MVLCASHGCVTVFFEMGDCTAVGQCLQVLDLPCQLLEVLWLGVLHERTCGQTHIQAARVGEGVFIINGGYLNQDLQTQ